LYGSFFKHNYITKEEKCKVENVSTTATNNRQPTPPVQPSKKPIAPTQSKPVAPIVTSPTPNENAKKIIGNKGDTEVVSTTKAEANKPTVPSKAATPSVTDKKATTPSNATKSEKTATAVKPTTEKPEKPIAAPKATEKPDKASTAPKQENGVKIADKAVDTKKAETVKQPTDKKTETPLVTKPEPEQTVKPIKAPRPNGVEKIVYLKLDELKPFKNHPFGIREDDEMKSLTESVKDKGVHSPALVRPIEGGGYEVVAGHRRQKASELAGFSEMPCIIREMSDDDAILAMTDDNLRQRSEILPSEKALSLKMQYEAIKHQGARFKGVASGDIGKRSIELVGERNDMNGKQVQRYIRLTNLVPDLTKAVDEKRLGFVSAVEMSFITPKNQNLIAVSMDGEQASPSHAQAKRMRDLEKEGKLNGDVIDGILCEEKKEVDKVIISGEELNKYFGKEKTPQEMKNQIIKLLDDWASKEKTHNTPNKTTPDRDK
jgi:hypothetical protein